jgi:hypothetical protein
MSRVTQKQIQYLARNPRAYLQFQATGRLPATVRPSSPLITLLEAIPPRLRMQIRGVRLSPDLGYLNGMQFHTVEQLLRWLKPGAEMLVSESWPAESCRDKRFRRRLTLKDLKPHCASWPDERVWAAFRISPDA